MIVLPQIKKDDELHGIIYTSQWLHKNKYLRLIMYCYPFVCVGYLCQFLHYFITQWKNVISLDIFVAVLSAEVMIAGLSNLDQEKGILEINQFRVEHFWDNNFLNKREKREFDLIVNFFVYSHYLSWFMAIFVAIAMIAAPFFSHALYNEDWSYLSKIVAQLGSYIFAFLGYYMVTVHEGFYAYTILHGYLQMKTLKAYFRHEFHKYEKIELKEKICSFRYQALIEGAFLRCIKQHKRVVAYGKKILRTYNRWMVIHFLVGATVFSLMVYCYIFDPCNCEVGLIIGIFHLILGVIFYHIIGDLFSEGYEDFQNELLKVKWYTLNKRNRQLYYMFLMFTQKKYEIELWPSMPITRSYMCKFVKMIYSGVALLASLKNNK